MTISRWAVLLGLVPVAAGAPLGAQEAVGGMPPGPWPVGFTRLARADATLAFLDAFLKGERAARARFEPGVRWPELGPLERLRR